MRFISLFATLLLFPLVAFSFDSYIIKVDESNAYKLMSNMALDEGETCLDHKCYLTVSEETLDLILKNSDDVQYEKIVYWESFLNEYDPNFITQWAFEDTTLNWSSGEDIVKTIPSVNKASPGDKFPVAVVVDTGLSLHDANFGNTNETNKFNLFKKQQSEYCTNIGKYDVSCYDLNGHGTHVAGIIASAISDEDVTGASYGKGQLYVINAYDENMGRFPTDKIFYALIDVYNKITVEKLPIAVVNMSLGGTEPSALIYDAIAKLRDKGVIVAVAAGNENLDLTTHPAYPASYNLDNIVTVGALDYGHIRKAWYSNYGNYVTIASPGSLHSIGAFYAAKDLPDDVGTANTAISYNSKSNQIQTIYMPEIITQEWTLDGTTYKISSGAHETNSLQFKGMKVRTPQFVQDISNITSLVIEYSTTGSLDVTVVVHLVNGESRTYNKKVKHNATQAAFNLPMNASSVDLYINERTSAAAEISKVILATSVRADTFIAMEGTSMATPYITGVILAGKALYPDITGAQLITLLYNSAHTEASMKPFVNGGKVVNVGNFLASVVDCKNDINMCPADVYPTKSGTSAQMERPKASMSKSAGCAMSTQSTDLFIISIPLFLLLFYRIRKKWSA